MWNTVSVPLLHFARYYSVVNNVKMLSLFVCLKTV